MKENMDLRQKTSSPWHPEASSATKYDHTVTSDPVVRFSGEKHDVSMTKQDISTAGGSENSVVQYTCNSAVRGSSRAWQSVPAIPDEGFEDESSVC